METSDEDGDMDPMDEIAEAYDSADLNINENAAEVVKKRGRKNFLTPRLASALDNAKITDGMAVHVLIACADALNHCVDDLVINRSTIHRFRQENRRKEAENIQSEFIENVI